MEQKDQNQSPDRFNIVFEKLEEEKKNQGESFVLELEASSETNKTISLFKEFQESMIESSFTIFTKS